MPVRPRPRALMLKTILIIVGIVVLGIAIYYGRYLFTKTVVDEALPAAIASPQATTSAVLQSIKAGVFKGIDFIHKGSGRALLFPSDGKYFIRFEDFQVTNGPDLYVYLTKNPQPSDKASLGEFINLGRLKGTVGNQNYELANLPDGYNTVVIWCQRFSALFSYAVLK